MLFETSTLMVLAQQNAANSPFVFPAGANFTTATNQGGAVFSAGRLGAAGRLQYRSGPEPPRQVQRQSVAHRQSR